jgi:hypothetical protein
VEVTADGRVLTRAEAIETYSRYYDQSASSLGEQRVAFLGDVVLISGRVGEEGTPYQARRLYVWSNRQGHWQLLTFQKTFVRSRAAKLEAIEGGQARQNRVAQPTIAEELTLARRNPDSVRLLLAEDSLWVDGYGEQHSAAEWLTRLTGSNAGTSNLGNYAVLHKGETTVVVGDESSTESGLAGRFTRVWTPSPNGMHLRFSQTSLAAVEVFAPSPKR